VYNYTKEYYMSIADRKPKPNTKLLKVNVPEKVWEHFFMGVKPGVSSIIDKLRKLTPQARGRGLTRVVQNVTEAEWEDLYARCVDIRTHMKGTTGDLLRAAICAKAMSFRMEMDGVMNRVRYTTHHSGKTFINGVEEKASGITRRKPTPPAPVTKVDDTLPVEPPTLVVADDVEEADDVELARFKRDLALGTK
jgi:hypothetical protein